jgi:hypothetical protein
MRCQPPPCRPRRYYGYASFSHGSLIHSLMRDRWHQRLDLTECQMFATMYKDAVHPSDTGRLLMVRAGRCAPVQARDGRRPKQLQLAGAQAPALPCRLGRQP